MNHRSSSALRPLFRPALYETIAERVLSHIVQSNLQPGERLPGERQLARQLGVSRSSVRQAIVALQTQRVLDVRHGDGTFLRHLDTSSSVVASLLERRRRLPEVLEARRALEIPIAAHAAQRRTAANMQAIDAGLEAMQRQVAAGEIGIEGDDAFHRAVTAAAHNVALADLMHHLAEAIAETRGESLSQPQRPPQSLADHEAIAEAIRRGDPEAAAAAMETHLDHVAELRLFDWIPGS